MNEKFRDIFNFAIANRAAFSLFPNLHRALVTATQMQTVLMNEDTIFWVDHAETTQAQVGVVDVVGLRVEKRRSAT